MQTHIRHLIVSLAIAASFAPISSGAITFTPLGDLLGGDFNSAAHAISNDGTTVVGASSSGVTNDSTAFRWTTLTGMLPLTDLPTGGFESAANAASGNGSVIAGYGTAATTEATSWTSPLYAPSSLGTLGGTNPFSRANDISADGSVIVGETSTPAGTEAFRWTSGGGMSSLGDFPSGGTNSVANAVSDDGSVVVGGGLHFGPLSEAFRWTSGPGLVGLGDLAGGTTDSLALGLSGDGNTVVGQSNGANGIEAFVWTVGSGMQGLGDLSGGAFESRAHDASADGSLIVGHATAADGMRAVIWSSGNLFDLNLIAAAVLPAGWLLEEAFGISSDGLAIVGRANNPDGNNEAFLLRLDSVVPVPEPGTGVLFALGLLAFGVRRQRAVGKAMATTAALVGVALLVQAAAASHDESYEPVVNAEWETAADGGMISDDVARYSVASKSRNNSVESLFVTGVRAKSAALQAAGINDLDVVTTAFDADTGAARWTAAYDAGLGSFDTPSGMELNYNNNILHVVADTGSDSVLLTYAVSGGAEIGQTFLPGAQVNGTTISVAGSEMAVVGQSDGRFYFADYESGPEAVTIDSRPVVGEAFDVAIHNKTWINSQGVSDWAPGDTPSWRTFVATGREGNFAGADVYTAAYRTDQTGHDPIWVQRWNGPDQNWDEGIAAETGYVRSLGKGFAWTAARSRDASGNWDIVVTAHDLATGAPVWSGETRTWGGAGGTEDAPVAMWYADATETLYVTGTTDRGFPHGTDIVTIAFHALTGHQGNVVFSSGDISNGDDEPTGIAATHDGQRVLVAAEVHDLRDAGGGAYRAGLFAFYAGLYPSGSALLSEGGAGVDRAGGVAVNIDQTHVLLGGSTDPTSTHREDLTGASFPRASFLPEPSVGLGLLIGFAAMRLARLRR